MRTHAVQNAAEAITATVELENSSWVVERGVRHTEWFVRLGDVWTRVTEVPSAVADSAVDDPGSGPSDVEGFLVRPPGCQYLCRVRLALPLGTALRRRVSVPRGTRRHRTEKTQAAALDLRRDILQYFKYEKPPLAVVESEFRVTRGGLVTAERWQRQRARARA